MQQKSIKLNKITVVIGALHDIYSRISVYIGMANTVMILLVFYNTVVVVTPWLAWLSPPIFILVALIAVIILSVVSWKYLIPTMMVYANYQQYKHENLLRKDIKVLSDKIDKLTQEIEKDINW